VTLRSPLALLLASLLFACTFASPSEAQTRRAFLVGVQRYSDGYINPLTRAVNDAKDLAKDLEDAGFDKKNIKVATDIRSKEGFDKEFDAFLKTVEPGDVVLFFFSGHGFGVEANQNNYLLFTDLRSPFTYTRSQLNDPERRNPDIVRLRINSMLESYQRVEIPQSGVATTEIERKIKERDPKTVIMILDACRSLVKSEVDPNDVEYSKISKDSGSRLLTDRKPPEGFLVLYSAQFGEQALESPTATDAGRNSLFTEVLRSELLRPGQSLFELAERVKLMVRAIAADFSRQQDPEIATNSLEAYDVMLVGSIGRERFRISQDKCAGENAAWDQIKNQRKRDLFERHRRRFDTCKTAEWARRQIAQLALSSDDPVDPPTVNTSRPITDCDRLAASELDAARPPEVPGLPFEQVDARGAVDACLKAVTDNPRVPRFQFNLGRAYHKLGIELGTEEEVNTVLQNRAFRSAALAYEDARGRGYVSALNSLAVLFENGDGVERDDQKAIALLKLGAEQGHPLAMYNLGLHYRYGIGVRRDWGQAYELFAKAAATGFVSAMVEYGDALVEGRGVKNPRRGVEQLENAARAGSTRAKFLLGRVFEGGKPDRAGENHVYPDPTMALLWLGRMAEGGDSEAQWRLATLMEKGGGLPAQQPEIAERYWRLAAHGGDAYAQVEFAERLRRGFVLLKQEHSSREAIDLLQRAMAQGSAQAAYALAQITRAGELGIDKSPVKAMQLAYQAIALAVQNDAVPRTREPLPEMAAAHMLVEMAKSGEAVDAAGRPLLNGDEIERLEKYYGTTDPETKQIKIRSLRVELGCGFSGRYYNQQKRKWSYAVEWIRSEFIWVWDWGRGESPTEFQFRNLERATGCVNNDLLRRTLIDIFEQSKKSKVAFADLTDQKVRTAQGASIEPAVTREPRGRHRRHRR
jgi:TPR repeat protein